MRRTPPTSRRLLGSFAVAVALVALAPAGLAQTPTPTPSTTPTPLPAVDTSIPAMTSWYGVTDAGRFDAANLVLDADGALWTGSALDNDVLKMWPDRTKATKWVFPTDAGPSSLLKDADGSFWVTELGGFNVAHFDPATGSLTRWADTSRRPTSLVRASDGTFWLPETNGLLAHFDAASGTFTYLKTDKTIALSYPWLDADGYIWTCDFLMPAIMRFKPDGSEATRWVLPKKGTQPSKIFRAADGKLWISLYASGQLAQFDEVANVLRTYALPYLSTPFDLGNYQGRIVYTDQRLGHVGMLDPTATKPVSVQTIVPETVAVTTTTNKVAPTTTTLTSTDVDVLPGGATPVAGVKSYGLAAFPVGNGASWGLAVDERRGRIYFATFGNIGTLSAPQANSSADDQYLPAVASAIGQGGVRWQTQVVFWNRGTVPTPTPTTTPTPTPTGTPTPSPTPKPVSAIERLYPTGWIAGISPAAAVIVPPNQIVAQDDPIGNEMSSPGGSGALRISLLDPSQQPLSDLFVWSRVFRTRDDGGTYGFARNGVKRARAMAAPETQFFFAPRDTSQRTNAGFLVLKDAKGTVSVVDPSGQVRGSFSFDFPSGYRWQGSTIFSALGIDPVPSARVVFSVTTGQVLPWGISIDPVTQDPIGLEMFAPKSQALVQYLPGVGRSGGGMGSTTRTELQLYDGGSADVHVTLRFRPAMPLGGNTPDPPTTGSVTVPAGTTLALEDVLFTVLGVDGAFGTLELVADDTIFAFARVTSADPDGGRFGFGLAARFPDDGIPPASRGIFIAATDNGWNVISSDLLLFDPADVPATATLTLTDAYGTPAGTMSVTIGPGETRVLSSVWYSIAGFGANFGRIDVIPADGSPPLQALLLRRDLRTLDTDPAVPFVIPR